jgi:four helix bundle protein
MSKLSSRVMMNKIKTHKDLDVWKEAMELARLVYLITSKFPKEELYGLTQQIRRSAVSVPSNIAEGAARNSGKEFVQFLYISLGSLAELETQLLLSEKLGFLQENESETNIERIRKMLIGLIKYLKG